MRLSECSYVVVDCETTGFHPSAYHRIVELARIPIDSAGGVGDTWSSLLRPDRDLGPTDVHGIRGRDLLDAPSFADVLGEILDRLSGRIVVAHNARFDSAFLESELARVGIRVAPLAALCTMELAWRLGLTGARARLSDCCAVAGVETNGPHTAAGDAAACAELFSSYLARLIDQGIDDLAQLNCPPPRPAQAWPHDEHRAAAKQRVTRFAARSEPSFLGKLARDSKMQLGADAMQVAPYLDLLDRALEDRRLSAQEQDDLAAAARFLELDAERLRALHADYVATLVTLAYRDGVVTPREREDLDLVAEALGVAGVREAIAEAGDHVPAVAKETKGRVLAGRSVCFTGALSCTLDGRPITREVAQHLAEEAGMIVANRVTRTLDVLVVADPHSMSGKARKAHEYGTRIVAETAFWPMIGIDVA